MNQWRDCTTESLKLIYESMQFERDRNRWHVWFNQPTWERWQEILIEIGQQLESRGERLGQESAT